MMNISLKRMFCSCAIVLFACSSLQAQAREGNTLVAESEATLGTTTQQVKIAIQIGSHRLIAIMDDNQTARDFLSLLPLTITLRDFSPAEKVSAALTKRLSTDGAAASASGAVGDIAYYAPWGNIAFYRGTGPDASGVIKIARIIAGGEILNQAGNVAAEMSILDKPN